MLIWTLYHVVHAFGGKSVHEYRMDRETEWFCAAFLLECVSAEKESMDAIPVPRWVGVPGELDKFTSEASQSPYPSGYANG